MINRRSVNRYWPLLALPLGVAVWLLVYWITCTGIFPTTLLFSYAYQDRHGNVQAEDLIGTYAGDWYYASDTLRLLPGGHLVQHVVLDDGRVEDYEGSWAYDQTNGRLILRGRLQVSYDGVAEVQDEEWVEPWLVIPKNRITFEFGELATYQATNSVASSPWILRVSGTLFNAVDFVLGKPDTPPLRFW